jgi:solute carrier family 13 (sodium-dependent dicarboxylate transporter), member 2/3/5
MKRKWPGLAGGLLLFIIISVSPPPEGLSQEGWYTAAVAVLMAAWWIFEVIPIPVTAMIPIVLFPVLGIAGIGTATAPYANPLIFLFMGGFIIAIAMQEWGLHRRIALRIISVIGTRPLNIITGFMISSAFMSMWVSNTAATMMMLPIALSVIELTRKISDQREGMENFAVVLMLAVAYSSNIGGIGTIIGTPVNALLVGFVNEAYGIEISFLQWMLVGVPLVVAGLPVIFYSLTRISFPARFSELPGAGDYIALEVRKLGRITRPELLVAIVFVLVAVLWITRPLLIRLVPGLSDAGIAITGGLLLFLIPADIRTGRPLLTWKAASALPWGVLLLFGGGLSLAAAIEHTGLAGWIGRHFEILHFMPLAIFILLITGGVIMLTELTSNTATAAAFLPVIGVIAIGLGVDPLMLTVPAAVAASCAFMLPVATPPNAIVFGSGLVSIPQMVRAGLWLNFFFMLLVTIAALYLIPVLFRHL